MPNRGQKKNPLRINHVVEARAGLIPASDDMADEICARTNLTARIIRKVKPRLGLASRDSDDIAITNILSDLRHYCDIRGLAFEKLDRAAYELYSEEKAYEATWPTLPRYLKSVLSQQLTCRMQSKI